MINQLIIWQEKREKNTEDLQLVQNTSRTYTGSNSFILFTFVENLSPASLLSKGKAESVKVVAFQEMVLHIVTLKNML